LSSSSSTKATNGDESWSGIEGRKPRAVDLGAGCGLTTMALACAGYDVWSSDKAQLLPQLSSNIADFQQAFALAGRNEIGAIRSMELNWTAFDCNNTAGEETLAGLCGGYPELLVCSDCLYSSSCIEPLLCVIEQVGFIRSIFVLVYCVIYCLVAVVLSSSGHYGLIGKRDANCFR